MIVGSYGDQSGQHGFLDKGGVFTTFDVPEALSYTEAVGINNAGQVVGDYINSAGHTRGFLYSDGVFTTLQAPGTGGTQAAGINDLGQIVGIHYDPPPDANLHSFIANAVPEPSSATLAIVAVAVGLGYSRLRRRGRRVHHRGDRVRGRDGR